jgi:hypothetical protein
LLSQARLFFRFPKPAVREEWHDIRDDDLPKRGTYENDGKYHSRSRSFVITGGKPHDASNYNN